MRKVRIERTRRIEKRVRTGKEHIEDRGNRYNGVKNTERAQR